MEIAQAWLLRVHNLSLGLADKRLHHLQESHSGPNERLIKASLFSSYVDRLFLARGQHLECWRPADRMLNAPA